MDIVTDVIDLKFYVLNSEYSETIDEITKIKQNIYSIEIEKIIQEKKLLELNEKIRKIEAQIMKEL